MRGLPLVLSRSARTDLVEIWQYIARDSESQADRFVDLLHEKCELLAENPEMGRVRAELRPGLRSFPVERYVIFYRATADQLQIVRVLSGYRKVEDHV